MYKIIKYVGFKPIILAINLNINPLKFLTILCFYKMYYYFESIKIFIFLKKNCSPFKKKKKNPRDHTLLIIKK